MIPVGVCELLENDIDLNALSITPDRIFELQSLDSRPVQDGYCLVINWQESTLYSQTYTGMHNGIDRAPRVMQIHAHGCMEQTRHYNMIDRILNRVDTILTGVEHYIGTDNVRITCIRKSGRSGNLTDEGWRTVTRTAVYGVLYDESAA